MVSSRGVGRRGHGAYGSNFDVAGNRSTKEGFRKNTWLGVRL